MAHMYEVGTRAWQLDTAEGWIASEVEDKSVNGEKVTLRFRLQNGEVCYLSIVYVAAARLADALVYTDQDCGDNSLSSGRR